MVSSFVAVAQHRSDSETTGGFRWLEMDELVGDCTHIVGGVERVDRAGTPGMSGVCLAW
jgi:hypothetical protein